MTLLSAPPRPSRKNLTPEQRAAAVAVLLSVSVKLEAPYGAIAMCAANFDVSVDQISRLWKRAVRDIKASRPINYQSGRKGRSGRKTRLSDEFWNDLNHAIELVPLEDRTNIRTLASTLGIPKSTLHDYLLAGVFRCHTASAKPMFTDIQRIARVKFAITFVHKSSLGSLRFDDMMDRIHLDEKWFYLAKDKQRYYLAEHEDAPHLCVKNKNFIVKVMFLVALARSRWDAQNHRLWDGKVGCWPFAVYEPAERSSKNRPAGTLEMKTFTVDRDIYRRCLCSVVIPEIKRVWPSRKRFVLQHDNAKPHVDASDPEVVAALTEGGWDGSIHPQPANSPDFNVLDLGFFASLQSLQHRKKARSIEELVDNVDEAFRELPMTNIDRVFLTLQSVLQASMDVDGGNKYLIPHLGKDKLVQGNGLLPPSLKCSGRVFRKAEAFLSSAETEAEKEKRT
ncbi:hypothetical protein P43SY_010266 [Pythium insidiosum]|uniref:Transposase n=1 Tax=Pythium insidiosum TaxID=114742 RepID=A0AAD5Q544_PYTIN|nr:hypothetical protein P43SY_010266 [Pythium insidiosum]